MDVAQIAREAAEIARASVMTELGPLEVARPRSGWPFTLDHPHQFWMTTSPRRLPGKPWPVDSLRSWSRHWDPLRSVIEYLKAEAASIPVTFVCKDGVKAQGQVESMKAFVADTGPIGGPQTRRIFEAKLFEDLLVVGAYAVWYEKNNGGDVLSCHAIDAATVKPRVDQLGWPDHEVPFEQWVIGVKVADFRPGELRYDGLHPRTDTPYFDSPVEYAVTRVTSGMRLDEWNLAWLTEANVRSGDVIALPEDWTPEQVMDFTALWDAWGKDAAGRQKTRFVPSGTSKIADHTRKDQDFQEFEVQVIRRLCAVFGVQPASIGYVGEQYKVTQGDSMDASRRVGLGRLLQVRKEFYDDLCFRLGCPDVECVNVEDDPDLQEQQARTAAVSCGGPFKTVDEVRADLGLGPMQEGGTPEGGVDQPRDDGVARADDDVVGWFTDSRSGKRVPITEAKAVARLAKLVAAVHNGDPPVQGADPGSTHDVRGRNLVGTDAYAVAVAAEYSRSFKGRFLGEEAAARYARRFLSELTKPGRAIGTWYDSESGQTWLDIVDIEADRASAIELGESRNQVGIMYLKDLTFIPTGGSGK